ncbi:alpha/beta fold hydrolase [Marinomonas mediterranea]|jgi:Predicted hydrolases or acyltransferases (alpha/beta hydrolase superfamily)|uniref:Alpha/beta hydrolase fold protein n=1 Tax=Marinomonas mediterranea (strain ATCC 700492 / JCM 21426 / NBRC 103028 / MMB-1) TaxID=717774 RepID=F2JXN7_MARM1|nr:alpha/beta hydrolase [Marinomonas mediterranea]ADZ93035.1 alpha/beta hydrolase fold protein [Marinomonas mediterranea MMB-1]WCN10944.1 alpha/beta fold hydrolase [Marinomonas mediterranea]WCN15006.1 alpha/beta fold hydrolase [Marinomonas mediterranea]WCN19050.1 alpha/beta fold hydrolase [Marinomonas mediterranea MMB-1]
MNIVKRNNVKIIGDGEKTLMLAHGFGCDQNMWRFLQPMLEDCYKIVLFDYVGCGLSDVSAFDKHRYQTLDGYALDVVEICEELNLENVQFVGHSVSSIIGTLAAIRSPHLFEKMIMVCPSPCFLNVPPNYYGGFEKEDLEELINLMDKNYIGWASYLAPLVMGQTNKTELIQELQDSFCSTDPRYAKPFAKATFFSDDRSAIAKLNLPTLILQSKNDNLASVEVGNYMHKKIANSTLEVIDAFGHCLHMTEPQAVYQKIEKFIER